MPSSILRSFLPSKFRYLAVCAVSALTIGGTADAFAIDRGPFNGGFVSDARPGYGAERPRAGSEGPGYGAEREYYGAENRRVKLRHHRFDEHPRYRFDGSFIEFREDADYEVRDGSEIGDFQAGVFPGVGSVGSFVYFGDDGAGAADEFDPVAASGARVIDVKTEELDRQTVVPGTNNITYVAATKIIRITSSNSATSSQVVQDDPAPALAPWSEGWARYCKRAHPGFDPARGTFVGSDGVARFCTGS